jgi:hypothetical protein
MPIQTGEKLTMQFLLCIPAKDEERGGLPSFIPPGAYVGYFDASARRLVFLFEPATAQAHLYISSEGWDKAFAMQEGHLPKEIVLDSHEAAWAVACWKAVQAQRRNRKF